MKNDQIKVTRYRSAKDLHPDKPPTIFVALLDVIIPKWGNFFIEDIKLFQKNGHFWIKFPEYKSEENGNVKYLPRCGFKDKSLHNKFQDLVLKSLDEYIKENNNIS